MTDESHPSTVQVLDHALRASDTPGQTRRWLLERAAAGAAGVAAGSALAPSVAFAHGGNGGGGGGAAIGEFGRVAVTTEALTVILLTELLRRVNLSSSTSVAAVKPVFEGAYAAELDHFRFTRTHWRPTTTKFWIPDGFFGGSGDTVDLTSVGMALVAGETLFINLYLIGVTTFARAGQQTFARYSAELAGCERGCD
jgi:hypothetical protein